MNKLCKCGCRKEIKKNSRSKVYYYMHSPNALSLSLKFKGHTYEKILGEKKAKSKKQNMHNSMINKNKGKCAWNKGLQNSYKRKKYGTLEERFGKAIALVKRIKNSNIQKNKTLKEKRRKNNKEKETKIKKGLMCSDDQLIQMIKDANKKGQTFTRTKLSRFLPISDIRIRKLGGIEVIANQANIVLEKPRQKNIIPRLGKNENIILNKIEENNNIVLNRQLFIKQWYVDGYDSINNIVYEIDEEHHKYTKMQDFLRQKEIENVLNCKFIRINEKEFLNNINNKKISDF